MCGRFALFTPPARLGRLFDAELADGVEAGTDPSWNIAPTSTVLGVRSGVGRGDPRPDAGGRVLDRFRWGLVPWWSDRIPATVRAFNARAETVGTRPSFREALVERRLIVPADGFFEWRDVGGRRREPHYFHRADGRPMAMAGLWERWHDPGDGDRPEGRLRSCAVITTAASPDMDGVHDRMPVVLPPDRLAAWLDAGEPDAEELDALLAPAPAGTLLHHPVDPRVGDVRVDEHRLVDEVPVQPSLGLPGWA